MSDLADFYARLTAAINQKIAAVYSVSITLIQFPQQGQFLWWYQNDQGYFNQGTFDYVSARVSPGDVPGTAQLSPSGGFPAAYLQLISRMGYQLSSADQSSLRQCRQEASGQVMTLLSDYQTSFGQITSAQIEEARKTCGATAIATRQDYIIGYVLGCQWSNRCSQGLPPLTYSEMLASNDFAGLFPAAPSTGAAILKDTEAYLGLIRKVIDLQSQVQMGSWTLAQLLANTGKPSIQNGGMFTVNPNTGAASANPVQGYAVRRSISQIQQDLSKANQVLTVTVQSEALRSSSLFSDGDDEVLYALRSAGSPHTLTIEYPGYTLIPVAPKAWQQADNTGWFLPDPLRQAWENNGKDVTGYRFLLPPTYNLASFSSGGSFGQLTNLLVSNPPRLTAHFADSVFSPTLRAMPMRMRALRIMEDLHLSYPYTVRHIPSARSGAFRLTFVPDEISVPQLLQSAFVIGATIDTPATGNTEKNLSV